MGLELLISASTVAGIMAYVVILVAATERQQHITNIEYVPYQRERIERTCRLPPVLKTERPF